MDDLSSLIARIRASLIRNGKIRPAKSIDTETGTSRHRGRRVKMMSENRRKPVAPPQFVPPLKPIRRGKGKAKTRALPHLETMRIAAHHDWNLKGGAQSVEVRIASSIEARLQRFEATADRRKIQRGAHIDMFLRDWELTNGASVRSIDWESAGGGSFGSTTLSEAVMDATTRIRLLKEFVGADVFDILVASLIYGAGAAALHAKGAQQHVIVAGQIREAVHSLANFYTPTMSGRRGTAQAARDFIAALSKRDAT